MLGKEIYKIYAPPNAKWTQWVRPVPFVSMDTYNREAMHNWVDRKILFINEYEKNTAIFIDLSARESIELGIGLAKMGYRPIPLFNGTDEQENSHFTTDTYLVECALITASTILKNISLKNDANPVFLLDNTRTNRYRAKESIFDNSWDLYKQDIPTAEYFKKNHISKIIIVSNTVQKDLKKIFLEFQKHGLEFYLTDGYIPIKKIKFKKSFKEMFEKEEI